MKYLKPEILYSKQYNENKNLITEIRNNYNTYLLSIKDKLNPKLVKSYDVSDKFHDFNIIKVNYLGFRFNKKNSYDKVEIQLSRYDMDINLFFYKIKSFIFSCEQPFDRTEQITICEIGISDNKYDTIEFDVSDGSSLFIEFEKFDVELMKKVI